MRMRATMGVALLALGAAGTALAVTKGGTLYVKAKNTRLMQSAAPSAPVLQVLQPGKPVTWLGADPKNKQWHQVEVDGKRGAVFQSNLSAKPPNMELIAGPDGVTRKDAAEFANSSAAVKLLSDGAIEYGKGQDGDMHQAVGQLQELERLAEGVTPERLARHAQKAKLFPVVGPAAEPTVASGGTP